MKHQIRIDSLKASLEECMNHSTRFLKSSLCTTLQKVVHVMSSTLKFSFTTAYTVKLNEITTLCLKIQTEK